MSAKVNIEKVAKGLGAEWRGKIRAGAGYFGAMQILTEVQERFRVPPGGGRATDPSWTKRRLVPLADRTLKRLERLARSIEKKRHIRVEPMQIAALLLENVTQNIADEDAERIVGSADSK